MNKFCPRCELEKDISDFNIDRSSSDGLGSCCRECNKIRSSQHHKKRLLENPNYDWEMHIWHKYNMTPEQYSAKLAEQNGVCEICHRVDSFGKRLSIDHCDDTKINRGLLCTNCNVSLGKFNHDLVLLRAAANYIEKYHPEKVEQCKS